ncbi:hypothetical protein [Frigoriglobus tundricola]|uniref:hypothetical protein n=1 Tax=Frigoriglobus tundricola TaxID=2774151 RepID=UPI00148EABD1|nr:hypothetical protein [Frigoriglobus tundricola]
MWPRSGRWPTNWPPTSRPAGLRALAAFVALRPAADPAAVPLLAVAVRFHFRRAVEDDPRLFQGLAFVQLGASVRRKRTAPPRSRNSCRATWSGSKRGSAS